MTSSWLQCVNSTTHIHTLRQVLLVRVDNGLHQPGQVDHLVRVDGAAVYGRHRVRPAIRGARVARMRAPITLLI